MEFTKGQDGGSAHTGDETWGPLQVDEWIQLQDTCVVVDLLWKFLRGCFLGPVFLFLFFLFFLLISFWLLCKDIICSIRPLIGHEGHVPEISMGRVNNNSHELQDSENGIVFPIKCFNIRSKFVV